MFIPGKFGIYLLNRKFSAGLSADQLFNGRKLETYHKELKINRHITFRFLYFRPYYQITWAAFMFSISWKISPSADIGLIFNPTDILGGLSYRTGERLSLLRSEICRYLFGYSTSLWKDIYSNLGTHEFTMALKFGDSSKTGSTDIEYLSQACELTNVYGDNDCGKKP